MTAEAEHGHGDEGFSGLEAECHSGDESDLGVSGLDEPVGEVVLDRGEDPGAVFDDGSLQFDKRWDPAASGPADPSVQGFSGVSVGQSEHHPEAFFE